MREKLHPFHIAILIYMTQSGVVIFSLPRVLAQHMGYNGWIALTVFYVIVALNISLISLAYRLADGKSIFQIIEHVFPKIAVIPLYIFLLTLWMMIGCISAKRYIIIYQIFVFPTTHPMLIKILVDTLAFLLIIKGIYNISKAATVFFWLVIWTILLLLFFLHDFQWINLTSFYFHESSDIVTGSFRIFTAFLGYELILLLFPYAEKRKGVMKAVHIGNLLTFLTYILVCLVCYGFYSFDQLKRMKFPMLDLLAYIEFPFVERIENLIFSLYLFTSLIGIVMYCWSALEAAQRILPKANVKWLAAIIIGVAYVVSWIPTLLVEVDAWLQYLGQIEIGVAFGLPLMLLLFLLLQKRRDEPYIDYNEPS